MRCAALRCALQRHPISLFMPLSSLFLLTKTLLSTGVGGWFLRLPKRAVPELNPGTTLNWRHSFPAGCRSSRLPPSRAGVLSSAPFVLRRIIFSLAARFMSVGQLV
jgi:hypothetical protein